MNRAKVAAIHSTGRGWPLLIVLFGLPGAGCYEHVVSVKGYDTQGVTIHEPNLREDSDGASDAQRRAKRRQDLDKLNRSVPKVPPAY